MMFLKTFLNDQFSNLPTQISQKPLKNIELKNGMFDNIYVSNSYIEENESRLSVWDYNTVMSSDFINTINAGNVDYFLSQTSKLRIKHRLKGDFRWVTIEEKEIYKYEDFQFETFDLFNKSGADYEYAIVPVINDVEGNPTTTSVYSEFNGLYIIEKDSVFQALANIVLGGVTRNSPSTMIQTAGSKYPYVFSNPRINFDTGTYSAMFMPYNISECEPIGDDTQRETEYYKKLYDFLCDGKPKVIKDSKGHMWLIKIIDFPQYTPVEKIQKTLGNTVFTWVEIGNANSNQDLYNNGLIDFSVEQDGSD